jgi:hypothetical protein
MDLMALAALSIPASKPWIWSLLGALVGVVAVGGIIAVATLLWARGVRRMWNAPELSEGFFRRLAALPQRLRGWQGGRDGSGTLPDVWQRFAAQLPPALRANLLSIPTTLVFGGARAGKTSLIDDFVDWPSMQGQFLPSLRDERLPLRISLGSRLLVQEFDASVFESDAPATAEGLTRLWQPLCQLQQPLIVVAIDANRLTAERMRDPSAAAVLMNEARMLVGKVALLSRLGRGQLKIRICLTHMDCVPGFPSLERFCSSQHLPLRVALQAAHSRGGGTHELLAMYRRYLPLALLRCKPEDFAGVVRFLHEMPALLRALEPYLAELVRDPTRRLVPSLDRLYFFSTQHSKSGESPFLRSTAGEVQKARGLRAWFTSRWHGRRHLLIAAAAALCVLTALGVAFWLDGRQVATVDHDLYKLTWAIKKAAGSHNPTYASSDIHALLARAGHDLHDVQKNDARVVLFRALRQRRKVQARELFVKGVRDSQLLPLLSRYKDRQRDDLVLFTLGALYSSAGNGLGLLVMQHLGEWSRRLELPPSVIADYIEFSDTPYKDSTQTTGLFVHGTALLSGLDQPHIWYEQLVALEKYAAARSLEPADLLRLREQLRPFVQLLDNVGKDPLVGQVYRLLSEEAPFCVAEVQGARSFSLAPPAWLVDQLSAFRGVMHLFHDSAAEQKAAPQNLYQALRLLVDADGSKGIPDEVFQIDLEGRQFLYSARQWLELLRRSRKGQMVRSLFGGTSETRAGKPRQHHRTKPKVSFPGAAPAQNPLDPDTLRRDVLPVLRELDRKLADKAALSADQRKALERLVAQESKRYAHDYCQALHAQYNHFTLGGSGRVETTLAALRGLVQKDGPLVQHIKATAARADVGELSGPYLEPLRQCLGEFAPLLRIAAADKEGNLPELKPYGELVGELIKQLEAPAAKAAEDGSKLELRDALPTAGRIALAILEGQPENLRQRFLRFTQERQMNERLQGPFLAPLRQVQALGESELNRTLSRVWEQGPRQPLASLFEMYPFKRAAQKEAGPADIDVLRPAQGAFWQSFQTTFQPVCIRQGGRWRARTLPGGAPLLPADLLPLVNRAEALSQRLFTADGQRQPLALTVKALPPRGVAEGTTALRMFLLAGKGGRSVFVPNGVAAPQGLQLDWSQPMVAAIGVDLQVQDGAPQTQSLEGPESAWSLFRLIERGQQSDKVVTWRLPSGAGAELLLSFAFSIDPFGLLQTRGGE